MIQSKNLPINKNPPLFEKSRNVQETMNLYNVYFVSKGTGPRTVQIEAQNSAGVKAHVEARYRSLQHHAEPVANICEKETRIVTHTVDGFEYRKSARVFSGDFSDFRELPPWTTGVSGRTDGQQLLPAKVQ